MLQDKVKVFCRILSCIFILNIIQANDEKIPKNKDPKKAFYFSLIPGMGQAYNGKLLKSAIIIGLEVSAYNAWKNNAEMYDDYHMDFPLKKHRYLEKRNKYAWWIWFFYMFGMLEAVVDAHLYPFDNIMESDIQNSNQGGQEKYE